VVCISSLATGFETEYVMYLVLARSSSPMKAWMRQIADWLKNLELEQYAQRFAENGIDPSVLPDLTDQDLEKLGVLGIAERSCAQSPNSTTLHSPTQLRPDRLRRKTISSAAISL
jgi:hypothetical protein